MKHNMNIKIEIYVHIYIHIYLFIYNSIIKILKTDKIIIFKYNVNM